MEKQQIKHIYAENRKAFFDYEIIEQYEAGIELYGEEVKSMRKSSINMKGSYALITKGVPSLVGLHIGEYKGGMRSLDPKRDRRILLSKKEILRLEIKTKEMGATLVPLEVYSKGNLIKVSLALAKGKKTWQKKETLKARDIEREILKKFR